MIFFKAPRCVTVSSLCCVILVLRYPYAALSLRCVISTLRHLHAALSLRYVITTLTL